MLFIKIEELYHIAQQYIKQEENENGIKVVIVDEATRDEGSFLVFFYQSKDFIATGDFDHLLLGNAPIIISKKDGKIYETGTAYPTEHYIDNYKKYGDPHATQPKIDDDYKPVDDPRVLTKKEVEDYINEIADKHNKD